MGVNHERLRTECRDLVGRFVLEARIITEPRRAEMWRDFCGLIVQVDTYVSTHLDPFYGHSIGEINIVILDYDGLLKKRKLSIDYLCEGLDADLAGGGQIDHNLFLVPL